MRLYQSTIGGLCLWLAMIGLLSGCALIRPNAEQPLTTEARTYYTLRAVWDTTYEAYLAHCRLVVQGRVSADEEKDVDQAWNRFRTAFRITLLAANNDWSVVAPSDVMALRENVLTLIYVLQ